MGEIKRIRREIDAVWKAIHDMGPAPKREWALHGSQGKYREVMLEAKLLLDAITELHEIASKDGEVPVSKSETRKMLDVARRLMTNLEP